MSEVKLEIAYLWGLGWWWTPSPYIVEIGRIEIPNYSLILIFYILIIVALTNLKHSLYLFKSLNPILTVNDLWCGWVLIAYKTKQL